MEGAYTLSLAHSAATLETVGGKGASLARLARAGLPVPDGFHVTTAAYHAFVDQNDLTEQIRAALSQVDLSRLSTLENASRAIGERFAQASMPADIANAIAQAYADLGDGPAVAVRSSATAEDLPDLSFAGQQETYLNIRGAEAVQEAIKRCWASLWTARAIGYRARHNIDQGAVSLAVVVQRLIPAQVAGIMFTANPMIGNREEMVISAAWGLGEAIVGGKVSPDTIVADKASGRVKEIETADKRIKIVPMREGTTEQAVDPSKRKARALDDAQVAELVAMGRQIEAYYGAPQDVEWCWHEGQFYIVQSRPITTLGKVVTPRVPPPSEWEGPNRRARYLRNNIVELIPDPMTPLFGTLGRRVINASMQRQVTAFMGKPGLLPEELIVAIHGYAYYNGAFTPGQIVQILWSAVGIMRRMFRGAVERWRDARLSYKAIVDEWSGRPWRRRSALDILRSVPVVLGAAIDYYVAAVGGVIPAAWITEGLFTITYRWFVKRREDPAAATFLLGFDSTPILAEKALYDLAQWARSHPPLAAYLSRTPATQLAAQTGEEAPSDVDRGLWSEWQTRFRAYLERYGATVYDLDFAKPTPADDPTPVVEALKLFASGQGSDPHSRQRTTTERREQATERVTSRLRGLRLRLYRDLLARAQRYAPLREDGLADIGLGYPLVRQMLLEVGRRLVQSGAVEQADDVFWLSEEQVMEAATAVDRGEPVRRLADEVRQHQALWRAQKQVTPPVSLPFPPKFLTKLLPAQFDGRAEGDGGAASRLVRGTPCSPGSVTATVRVLRGPEEFDELEVGDVLVTAITTPAWTPLFAMASAIVTDVGGPLSHGSIVAREYGIPAVLGTGVATRRLHTGDRVRVDGDKGTVEILDR